MQKSKIKSKILITISVFAVIIVLTVVFLKATELSRAIKNMDIDNKQTVVHVLKYADNNTDVLCDIATEYLSKKNPLGAGILLHILQSVDPENTRAKTLLKDYYTQIGADPIFINQVDMSTRTDIDFKITTQFGDTGYGGIDGIYCQDFDGYIRYKLSGARAKSVTACDNGVYFLDSADNRVKLLSADGAFCKPILENTREFVYHDKTLYSIDINSKIIAPSPVTLNEGEFGANLRIIGEDVLCDVFNESYQLIDTITLN